MLKFRNFLFITQNILLVILFLATTSMFYIRYKMYNISNTIGYLDNKIEKLKNDKNLLTIELTYLSSTERLLSLIDKNPDILNDKQTTKVSQLKTKKDLVQISLAKAANRVFENKKIAKNENLDKFIEKEL